MLSHLPRKKISSVEPSVDALTADSGAMASRWTARPGQFWP